MRPRLYWTPTNALGTAWALMFTAERDGCGRYGLAPPLWRSARARLLKAAVRP